MIRLLLVDDQMIIRQGLKSLLESKPDFVIVGDADNGESAMLQQGAASRSPKYKSCNQIWY